MNYMSDHERCLRHWEATRRPAFASRAKINGLRNLHGDPLLSFDEYEAARLEYYARYPDAVRHPQCSMCRNYHKSDDRHASE